MSFTRCYLCSSPAYSILASGVPVCETCVRQEGIVTEVLEHEPTLKIAPTQPVADETILEGFDFSGFAIDES